jgi:hypothetical protein
MIIMKNTEQEERVSAKIQQVKDINAKNFEKALNAELSKFTNANQKEGFLDGAIASMTRVK